MSGTRSWANGWLAIDGCRQLNSVQQQQYSIFMLLH
jgi:hypothetical protein